MKLITTRDIFPEEDNFNCHIEDFERKIAELYIVYPVRSFKAYEEFKVDTNKTIRLIHEKFEVLSFGSPANYERMFDELLGQIRSAWDEGSFLMWRKYPELAEYTNNKYGTITYIKLRLGSIAELKIKPQIKIV